MGWRISYPLGKQQRIEIRSLDPSKTYGVSRDAIELTQEQEWREFLEAVRKAGKAVGWEEKQGGMVSRDTK